MIVGIAYIVIARCTRYNIVIKFVSDWAAGRWFSIYMYVYSVFSPPIKLTVKIYMYMGYC